MGKDEGRLRVRRREARQPREHPVPCSVCGCMTWAVSAICGACSYA